MRVLVGSGNPVKRAATADAFGVAFDAEIEVEGVAVESGVPDQPIGGQTWEGAINRARTLAERPEAADAEFTVGLEGGIERAAGRWFAFGAMCVRHREGREGLGSSARFELPARVMEAIEAGEELGAVIDGLVDERDTKRRGGAIEYFTDGAMDRRALYRSGLIVALGPFLHPEAWRGEPERPRIEGVVETALYVEQLERSERFYRELFGAETLVSDERMRALSIGNGQLLLLFRRGAEPEPDEEGDLDIPHHEGRGELHVAFGIARRSVEPWLRRMQAAGIELESRVDWPRGGVSLYFRDPDRHSIELVTRGCWSIY